MTDTRPGSRVLVVDDDVTLRFMARQALEGSGFEVIEAGDGMEAQQRFAAGNPCLVLLDVMMPKLDGFATCAALREQIEGEDVPILMMTGLDDVNSINRAYELGATDFITKPINYVLLTHRVRYMLRAAEDIAERQRAEEQIFNLAFYDSVTGLPNRAYLNRHLGDVLSQAERHDRLFALLSVGIDNFGRVNDTLGRDVGDAVLKVCAQRLIDCVRRSDYVTRREDSESSVARLADDEFIVLLTEIKRAEDAGVVARRITESLARRYVIEDTEVYLTASTGISLYPENSGDEETLMRMAGATMHATKEQGGAAYQFYAEAMNSMAVERLELEGHLRRAVEGCEFELYYQPKVEFQSGLTIGLEALLRWDHPELGMISPADFIPLAEETGLIVPLGEWVIRTACQQSMQWRARGIAGLPMAVNLSPRQFKERNLPDIIQDALESSGLDPHLLEVELTEGILMEDTEASRAMLAKLKAMGLRIALDDFGTGYSSLSYLQRFPIVTLKIDRSFLQDIVDNPQSGAIVSAIISMSHSLNLMVVAEGVETEEQAKFLMAHECDGIQGYYFSRPLTSEGIAEFLSGAPSGETAVR